MNDFIQIRLEIYILSQPNLFKNPLNVGTGLMATIVQFTVNI